MKLGLQEGRGEDRLQGASSWESQLVPGDASMKGRQREPEGKVEDGRIWGTGLVSLH